ncbi:MAG: hypothetical protein ACE5E1_03780 [Phycisphaerae bacterium]
MCKSQRKLLRWGPLLPVLVLYQTLGCLPDDAFTRVLGENIVLTSAIAIQSITSIIFNGLFGFI